MDIILAQIVTLGCLFLAMFTLFALPHIVISRRPGAFHGPKYQVGLSLANCLSAGVFLATFFVGLLPEVRHMIEELWPKSVFPITETIIFAGFFTALFIEQSAMAFKEWNQSRNQNNNTDVIKDMESSKVRVRSGVSSSSSGQEEEEENEIKPNRIDHGHSHSHGHSHGVAHGHSHGGTHGHSHVADWSQLASSNEGGVRIVILLLALGVHSVFEGLALGLQTNTKVLYSLFVGVAVHECLVAFALGVSVARNKLSTKSTIKLAVVFAASIPCGQVIGIIIGSTGGTSWSGQVANAVLQGLAAGTFIHVTFLEVIPSEFRDDVQESWVGKFLKLVFLLLGFLLLLGCNVGLAFAMGPHGH